MLLIFPLEVALPPILAVTLLSMAALSVFLVVVAEPEITGFLVGVDISGLFVEVFLGSGVGFGIGLITMLINLVGAGSQY